MRLYSFTNMYLSSLQKGIQTAHIVSELVNQFNYFDTVIEWVKNYKTIIILDGGNSANLTEVFNYFENMSVIDTSGDYVHHGSNIKYCYVYFREDEQSLNGALTAVGILLPENIYKLAELLRQNPNISNRIELDLSIDDQVNANVYFCDNFIINTETYRLASFLNKFKLAN